MAAIITNDFRKNLRKTLLDDIVNSQNYFIGIGKSDPWPLDQAGNEELSSLFSVPLPQGTIQEKIDARNNLQTLVKVMGTHPLMPRNEWVAGRRYKTYDPSDPNIFYLTQEEGVEYHPCYVSYKNRVYVCLSNNGGGQSTSTIPNDYTDFKDEVNDTYIRNSTGADGYVWAFVQQNNPEGSNEFYTDSFIEALPDLDPTSQAADIQNAKDATGGLLYGFKIINGGTGVLATDAINLLGSDTLGGIKDDVLVSNGVASTPFTVTITGGVITEIKLDDIVASRASFLDYEQATIEVANHPEVQILPLIAPKNGFGFSPTSDLPTWYAGITADFNGDVETEALVNTSFRQITLVKNPVRNIKEFDTFAAIVDAGAGEYNTFYVDKATSTVYTWNGSNYVQEVGVTEPDNDKAGSVYAPADAYDALSYFTYDSDNGGITQAYEVGSVITQPATGAKAWLDAVDVINERIYYHQNSAPEVNLKKFDPAETTIEILEPGSGTPVSSVFVSIGYPEHVHASGDILFLENRKRIERDQNQNENIKLVIQL